MRLYRREIGLNLDEYRGWWDLIMVYYLVYTATTTVKDRSRVPVRLQALGGDRLGTTFWRIPDNRIAACMEILGNTSPIVFRKQREVYKAQNKLLDKQENVGSLVLVQVKLSNTERERLRTLFSRIPFFRVSRSVMVFAQRSTSIDPRHELMDWQQFYHVLKHLKIPVRVFPNLILADHVSQLRLIQKAERKIVNAIDSIQGQLEIIKNHLKQASLRPLLINQRIHKGQSKIRLLRKISRYFNNWLHVNYDKPLQQLCTQLSRLKLKQQQLLAIEMETL